jgi:hypothetical protein
MRLLRFARNDGIVVIAMNEAISILMERREIAALGSQ